MLEYVMDSDSGSWDLYPYLPGPDREEGPSRPNSFASVGEIAYLT